MNVYNSKTRHWTTLKRLPNDEYYQDQEYVIFVAFNKISFEYWKIKKFFIFEYDLSNQKVKFIKNIEFIFERKKCIFKDYHYILDLKSRGIGEETILHTLQEVDLSLMTYKNIQISNLKQSSKQSN